MARWSKLLFFLMFETEFHNVALGRTQEINPPAVIFFLSDEIKSLAQIANPSTQASEASASSKPVWSIS